MDQKPSPLSFPKKFYWGASSSAHQVEGDTHNQWSIWEEENAATQAQKAKYSLTWLPDWEDIKTAAEHPANYISGKAANHYRLYEEDFDILTKLNMNAFRFSIEWSRIEPKEGEWDPLAIEHYRLYLHALKRRHIEPFVTLWHWTMPEWFVKKGGFEKRTNIKYFVRFASKMLDELGGDFRYVITLNEPEVYMGLSYAEGEWPPQKENKLLAFRVYMNLASAHKQVYKAAKNINRKFVVGAALNIPRVYAGDDALVSRLSAGVTRWVKCDFFMNRIENQLDFIGLNYYFSNRFYGNRVHNPDINRSDLGWDMEPQDIEFVLDRLHERYEKPIIVTENGLADREDQYRKWWIGETIAAMHRAMQKGVKLEGYLHWSLTDNFEWAYGFWPRFGLVAVDYKTQERTIRPSALWFGKVIKKMRQE
jgi:beta-glucosidase